MTAVSGADVTIGLGAGATAKLDLGSAAIEGGQPLAAVALSSVAVGDLLYVRLSVDGATAAADGCSGVPVPVGEAYDLGPASTTPSN